MRNTTPNCLKPFFTLTCLPAIPCTIRGNLGKGDGLVRFMETYEKADFLSAFRVPGIAHVLFFPPGAFQPFPAHPCVQLGLERGAGTAGSARSTARSPRGDPAGAPRRSRPRQPPPHGDSSHPPPPSHFFFFLRIAWNGKTSRRIISEGKTGRFNVPLPASRKKSQKLRGPKVTLRILIAACHL